MTSLEEREVVFRYIVTGYILRLRGQGVEALKGGNGSGWVRLRDGGLTAELSDDMQLLAIGLKIQPQSPSEEIVHGYGTRV